VLAAIAHHCGVTDGGGVSAVFIEQGFHSDLRDSATCTPMRPEGRIRLQAALECASGCFVVYRASSTVQVVSPACIAP
jgi:hypothetical protein